MTEFQWDLTMAGTDRFCMNARTSTSMLTGSDFILDGNPLSSGLLLVLCQEATLPVLPETVCKVKAAAH